MSLLFSSRLLIRSLIIKRNFCAKPKPYRFLRDQHIRREFQLNQIKDFVIKQNIETKGNIDWNEVINQLSEQKLINKLNFEVHLMSAFISNNETDRQMDKKLFESMVEFIKKGTNVLNNSISVSHYCHFISHFNQYINDSDIQLIRRTTDQLLTKYNENRLPVEVLNHSLLGLSKSSKDNCLHSIQILDQINKTDYKLINQIIDSSLDFKLIDQTFQLIKTYSNIKLDKQLIHKFIITMSECNPSFQQIIDLFSHLSKSMVVLDVSLLPQVMQIFDRLSYKTFPTSIGQQNGLCLKCDQKLAILSTEEQKTLIKDFHSIVFNKENDLLMKSFAEYENELRNFDKFMKKVTKEQPLDLVIDGLNLAFFMNPVVVEDKNNLRKYVQKYPRNQIDSNIVEMLSRLNVEKYENVLIIGRNHMKNWKLFNQFLLNQRKRISMFYAMNKTQDDCYILYATLQNPNTLLVSNDLYRDYCEKMSQKGNLFERWLKTHQIFGKQNNKWFAIPNRFEHKINVSSDKSVIHIPFESNENLVMEWICCQKL